MNEKNLKPLSQRTKEERREIAKQGGIASGKVRQQKAIISSIYAQFLANKTNIKIEGKNATGEMVLQQVIQKIFVSGNDSAKIALLREMREATEGSKTTLLNPDGSTIFPSKIEVEIVRPKDEQS